MQTLQVLVVEDDVFLAVVLKELLAALGHRICHIAATQAEAVTAARRHKPDLMIVDQGLLQGDGLSTVDEVDRSGISVAHVFVSGNPARVKDHRPTAVVVRKPFRLNELTRAIDAALATSAQREISLA